MKKILISLALVLSLGACTTFSNLESLLSNTNVSPTMVIVAGNTFNGLEITAAHYLKLTKCTATNGPICRSPVATAKIIPAIRSGRAARNALEAFLTGHPTALGAQGAYDALKAANDLLQSIFTQYKVGVAS